MRVVQTVFGVFHHFELARELQRRGLLERIYSTWYWSRLKREGIPRDLVGTFPWIHTPEMFMRRIGLEPQWALDITGYSNALLFDSYVQRQLRRQPPPDALIAISGSSLRAGQDVQSRGGVFICDRGSSHIRYQDEVVGGEYRRWKASRNATDTRDVVREELIYQAADAISVPSTFSKRSFLEMGVPAEKVHVIPYGVRLENFRRTREPEPGSFDVLFAGAVGLRKGIPYLLQAFAQLRHSGKRLRIAGGMQGELKAILPTLPQENVEFLGSVPQSRLAELMSRSRITVLPSVEDGFGLVLGQALACGCPVLATTNTGAEDLITDGVEGFIVPIRDAPALTERMQLLADDPALQQRMSEAALKRVAALGGWTDYGDRWESLLSRLTGQEPPPTK